MFIQLKEEEGSSEEYLEVMRKNMKIQINMKKSL